MGLITAPESEAVVNTNKTMHEEHPGGVPKISAVMVPREAVFAMCMWSSYLNVISPQVRPGHPPN
jgi:hypothetical protein